MWMFASILRVFFLFLLALFCPEFLPLVLCLLCFDFEVVFNKFDLNLSPRGVKRLNKQHCLRQLVLQRVSQLLPVVANKADHLLQPNCKPNRLLQVLLPLVKLTNIIEDQEKLRALRLLLSKEQLKCILASLLKFSPCRPCQLWATDVN